VTDHLKQSISALLDDEVSEIEVHRLVREFDSDAELKLTWIRYAQVRAVSQGYHQLDENQHLALHDRISAAIAAEENHEIDQIGSNANVGWRRQAAGFAVAASLVAAVLVSVNLNDPSSLEAPGLVNVERSTPIDVQTVSTSQKSGSQEPQGFSTETEVAFSEDELDLRELDELKQQQLREYLMRHDRMSRLNNNARTVNYSGKN
jgi:sigma-E factor negative regulatory protein RseA